MAKLEIDLNPILLLAVMDDNFENLLVDPETRLDAIRRYEEKNEVEVSRNQIDMLLSIEAQSIEELYVKYTMLTERKDD